MIDAIIVVVMLSAIAAFVVATAVGTRRTERADAAAEAERQEQRDRDMALLREGVEWAMAMTPRDWVKS